MQRHQIHSKHKKKSVSRLKNNPLLEMAGFAKGFKRNISRNVDEIYFRD